jgi:hypothetical protein
VFTAQGLQKHLAGARKEQCSPNQTVGEIHEILEDDVRSGGVVQRIIGCG